MEDNKLVDSAKKRAKKLHEAEAQLEAAKLAYHQSIKNMHENGMSYRQIALALEISHQRVHQIVSTHESLPTKKTLVTTKACNFCKSPEDDKTKIAKLKNTSLCDDCVIGATKTIQSHKQKSKKSKFRKLDRHSDSQCTTCNSQPSKKREFVQYKKHSICNQCLGQFQKKLKQ